MVSRRQFLRGDFSTTQRGAPESGAGVPQHAAIGPACVAERNVVCRSCADACPENAIRFTPRIMAAALPQIAPERCTGCGDCVNACPSSAVVLV